MHSSAAPARDRLRFELSRLHTGRQFTAVLDYLFDIRPRRVQPVFAEIVIVDQSLVFARSEGDAGAGYFVGRRAQLEGELAGFAEHLGLVGDQRDYVLGRIAALPRR